LVGVGASFLGTAMDDLGRRLVTPSNMVPLLMVIGLVALFGAFFDISWPVRLSYTPPSNSTALFTLCFYPFYYILNFKTAACL